MAITAFGQSLSVDEWSARSGIKPATIKARLYRGGWSKEDAVSKPTSSGSLEWLPEHAVVMRGAADGSTARETAVKRGWTEERVLRRREQAIRLLGARNLMNAVAIYVSGRW